MAKDDYFVLVGRILVYLYSRLKGRDGRDPMEYLQPGTKEFPISRDYFDYIIRHMYKNGFLEGMELRCSPDGEVLEAFVSERTQITPAGIEYLEDNRIMRKVIALIPGAAEIIGSFI